MRVVIDNAALRAHRSCKGTYVSPEWDSKANALVYTDFDATVKRLLSTKDGADSLEWLVSHKLVPMTADEFIAAKKKSGGSNV